MANITAALVKELRERTGAGMMDCKKALVECDGDMDKAIDFLREKGLAAAAKKAGRIAAEGMVDSFVDENGVGVTVEVNCETDFVANTDRFKDLCRDFAKHIAAAAFGKTRIAGCVDGIASVRRSDDRSGALQNHDTPVLFGELHGARDSVIVDIVHIVAGKACKFTGMRR